MIGSLCVQFGDRRLSRFGRTAFNVGTCEASRFDSNSTIPIRFESNGPIRNF